MPHSIAYDTCHVPQDIHRQASVSEMPASLQGYAGAVLVLCPQAGQSFGAAHLTTGLGPPLAGMPCARYAAAGSVALGAACDASLDSMFTLPSCPLGEDRW